MFCIQRELFTRNLKIRMHIIMMNGIQERQYKNYNKLDKEILTVKVFDKPYKYRTLKRC